MHGSNVEDFSMLKELGELKKVGDISYLRNVEDIDISFCGSITDISCKKIVKKLMSVWNISLTDYKY